MAESITIESVTDTVRVVGDPLLAEATREPCVRVVLDMTRADAEALATAKKAADGAGGVVPGDVARQVSDPVCDALIAAGYGTNP